MTSASRVARSIPALGAVTLVALPYVPGLWNGFVWLDHEEIVEGMLIVRRWSEVPSIFIDDRNFAGYHRPFYDLLHSLDRAVWGLDPFGFHLSSLLLHLANVALVLLLLRRAIPSRATALSIAALWGLHPVNSAAVGLIHAKADVFVTTALCAALLSLAHALRSAHRNLWGAFSFLCFAVALLSKETAFVLPIAIALSPFLVYRPPPDARRWLAGWVGAASALALACLLPRLVGPSPFDLTGVSRVPLGERLLTFATVYVDSARKLVVPLDLSVADTVTRFSALSALEKARDVTAFVLLAAVQVGAWLRAPWTRPWILLWNLALVPVAQIVPLQHFRADRFLYLPSLGLVGLAVEGGARIVAHASKPAAARAAAALVLALCAAFALRTAARVRDFESDETLFEEELRRTPDYVEGLSALARAFDRASRHREAEPYWRAALAPHPGRISYINYDVLVVDYAYNLLAQDRVRDAYELLLSQQHLVTGAPGREELRYNLGVAAFRLGRFDEALPLFADYARAHPKDARCRYLLGVSALRVGDRRTAAEAFAAYLTLAPDVPDRARVEAWLAELGRP